MAIAIPRLCCRIPTAILPLLASAHLAFLQCQGAYGVIAGIKASCIRR